ncbi:MAG: GldG family protein [Omnitrophica WOR_2 bacterium]
MKIELRRFAPFGLYLALIAALASAGLFIVQREWNLPLQVSLGLIIIGLALFAVLDPERVRTTVTGRQARYGSNALVMSIAFIGIVAVVNYIGYQYPKRWDLTEGQQHTLVSQTLDTLKSLPQPVSAQAFFTQGSSTDTAKNLLNDYKYYSNGKFNYQFIDPNTDPVAARAANVTTNGTVVLNMGDRQEKITTVDEQDLTGALVRLMAKKQAIYFLTGHGEISPEDSGNRSYAQLKQALQNKSYTVNTLSLLTTNKIPDDARAIVIGGPTKPLSDNEVKLLSDYVNKGGNLIVMEEPTIITQFGESPDPLASYLSKDWGISLDNDIIADLTSTQPPFFVIAAQYSSTQPITSKLVGNYTGFPTARSVTAGKAPSGETLTELIKTAGPQTGQMVTWGENDMAALKGGNIQFDQGKDLPGPVSLAVSGERTSSKSRIVVFGDSEFASDQYYPFYGNGDLLINSIDWVTEQENLINLTAKAPVQRIMVQPQKYTMNLILLGSVFVLPGIVLVTGIATYIQRRRRG